MLFFNIFERKCCVNPNQEESFCFSPRFLPFVLVQCSIALAAVNRLSEKISPKNEMNIEGAESKALSKANGSALGYANFISLSTNKRKSPEKGQKRERQKEDPEILVF